MQEFVEVIELGEDVRVGGGTCGLEGSIIAFEDQFLEGGAL